MEKDVVFLKDAQSADVGDGVPRGCLLEDLPFQCVSYSLSFEFVDVLGEAGAIPFRVSDVRVMTPPPTLHGLGSGTCVGLHLAGVSPGDCGFVDHIAHLASNARHHLAGLPCLQGHASTVIDLILNCCSIFTI